MKLDGILRSTDSMFFNTECMFIEYRDVINAIDLSIFTMMAKSNVNSLYNLKLFENYTNEQFMEFYINRKQRCVLLDVMPQEYINLTTIPEIEKTIWDLVDYIPQLCTDELNLNMVQVVKQLSETKLVKKFVIYTELYSSKIKDHIQRLFPSAEYVYGDFAEVIKNIPTDTTYVFSDVKKIQILHDIKRLNLSSVMIPFEYRYNMDSKMELNVNLEEIAKDSVFKMNMFRAISSLDE